MAHERIAEIRARYRDQNGELNVSEDDPRYAEGLRNMTDEENAKHWGARIRNKSSDTAVMSALDHDCAERGHADAVYGEPVLTEAKRLRDSYRDRIAEMRASIVARCLWTFAGGFALGALMGVLWMKAVAFAVN
jgi:hypothetical protein